MALTNSELINKHIKFADAASIKYYLETGMVNGTFFIALDNMIKEAVNESDTDYYYNIVDQEGITIATNIETAPNQHYTKSMAARKGKTLLDVMIPKLEAMMGHYQARACSVIVLPLPEELKAKNDG